MNVLITGGLGTVGTAITDHLGDDDRFTFTTLDVNVDDGTSVVADVRDYDNVRPAFTDQDAVIHLALTPGLGGPNDRGIEWSDPFADNLRGITNVYEAALDADLDTIVFASSNHAVGMVEVEHAPEVYHHGVRAGHDEPHRPDSLYGLTKSFGEDIGRFVAEVYDIRFYGLRIGAVRSPEYDHPYGDAERLADRGAIERDSEEYDQQVARMKGLWQSRRDLAHMVECCLLDESVVWDHFYGVSANERRWLDDLEHARETIGYDPADNGEEWDAPP